MNNPIIKKGSIQTVYKQWLTEKYPQKKVMVIEFLGFRFKQGRYFKNLPKPFYTPEKEAYIMERWRCQDLKTGRILECGFRHPVSFENKNESSLSYWTEPLDNSREVNLLTDTLEEFYSGAVNKRIHPNKQLKKKNKLLLEKIQTIENLLVQSTNNVEKTGLFLMLRQKQSPTLETFNSIKKWKNENIELYDQLLYKIKNYEKNFKNADDSIIYVDSN